MLHCLISGAQSPLTRRWTNNNISVTRIYQNINMDNQQAICKTGNPNCLSTMKCVCATTQEWVASTSGLNKKKKIEQRQHVNSCARREAGVLELYESRIQQQNKREREVKMYKIIIDEYLRVSKQYLPCSVSDQWFGEAGLLSLPRAATSTQPHGVSAQAVIPTPRMPPQQASSSSSDAPLPSNPPRRIAFIGDGSLVNGKVRDVYIARIICRGCQVEKTMNKASNEILCLGCDIQQ